MDVNVFCCADEANFGPGLGGGTDCQENFTWWLEGENFESVSWPLEGGREELEGDQWPMASVLIKRACVTKPFLKSWF